MQTQFEVLVQSNLSEFLKTHLFVPLVTAFISIFGENFCLEFEIDHQVLKISKKLTISFQFGKQLRAAVIVVSSANGTFSLLFPGCIAR